MKKTSQAFLLLSLLYILLCLSSQVRVTEARFRHLGEDQSRIPRKPSICIRPSPPCRAPLGSRSIKPCLTVPRPPRGDRCSTPNH
ncbi:hypothetical protein AALP_AA5G156900 [Arabis alpina]|uniref:Uncharacterized protein n=1 Tax=Arabis alpina TaxID=50452 RepID=A0A087GXC1_ARAAL|nr:hypothetical protein AALP_AA5G156900 [Arabis alpina]